MGSDPTLKEKTQGYVYGDTYKDYGNIVSKDGNQDKDVINGDLT